MRYRYYKKRSKRQTQRGGKAGFIFRMINIPDNAEILGAGSNGLITLSNKRAIKLFYDLEGCKSMNQEAAIQKKARQLLEGIVKVPDVHETINQKIWYKDKQYLCGIIMDRVPLVESFDYAVHILLGYKQDDIDTIWTRDYRTDPSDDNPPRGFFAGVEMIEAIWTDGLRTDISIEMVAHTMGVALRKMIDGGIIPYDLEWIYGGDGNIYLIDFGFCEWGSVNPIQYLNHTGSWGLGGDYYIPHEGHRGYKEFMRGFSG